MVKKICNLFKEDYDWKMRLEYFNKKITEMINGQRGTSEKLRPREWLLDWKVTMISKRKESLLKVAGSIFGLYFLLVIRKKYCYV